MISRLRVADVDLSRYYLGLVDFLLVFFFTIFPSKKKLDLTLKVIETKKDNRK